ncbi:MAG: hypothetical protein GEU91_22510 [Rhizobiales bacterium]|nr:hypothetical protein [Hyphomicrobiales bacterium]
MAQTPSTPPGPDSPASGAPGPGAGGPGPRGLGFGPGRGVGPDGQGPRRFGWGPGAMMGPGMMGGRAFMGGQGAMMCNPRAAGLAEWRVAQIQRAVRLTEAQRKALEELSTASAKAAETIAAACPSDIPATSSARMALMEKRVETMLQAIRTVRPAFDAFYASLSDEQKARFDTAGPRRWGWPAWAPRRSVVRSAA